MSDPNKRSGRTRADTTLQGPPKPGALQASAPHPSASASATTGSPGPASKTSPTLQPRGTVTTLGEELMPKKGGSYPEFSKRVTNCCRCPQAPFLTKFASGRNKQVDFHSHFTTCLTCNRRGPEFLCLKCLKCFCHDHIKRHYTQDTEHHLYLFHELVRYEEAFYCARCESFVVVEPFDDFLDAMFVSKGSFVDIPVTHKHLEVFENHGNVAVSGTMQGWRSANEDAHCVYLGMPNYPNLDFVGVFDGHGGPLVARYTGTKLITYLEGILARTDPTKTDLGQALTHAFVTCDSSLSSDSLLSQNEIGSCGTTANVVIVDNPGHQYVCANAGDARSVLCRAGKAVPLSVDHRPSNPVERDRIRAAGSRISDDDRVEGLLAVSRAIGDFDFKQAGGLPPERQAVSCVPDITRVPKSPDDEFILTACDGIWDCLSSQQVCDLISQALRTTNSPVKAVEAILERCVAKDITDDGIGTDNMSVVLLMLKKTKEE